MTVVVVSLIGSGCQIAAGRWMNNSGGGSGGSSARSMRVVCAALSRCSASTRLTTRSLALAPHSSRMLSPFAMPGAVPRIVTVFVAVVTAGWRWRSSGRMAFQSWRPAIGSIVSKNCGRSPGPGMLCARVPSGTGTSSGRPVSSIVNARCALAATPGRGT